MKKPGLPDDNGIRVSEDTLVVKGASSRLIEARFADQMVTQALLGVDAVETTGLWVQVRPVPDDVYFVAMLREGRRDRMVDAVSEDSDRIDVRQQGAQQIILPAA